MAEWEEKLPPIMKEKLARIGEATSEEKQRIQSKVSGRRQPPTKDLASDAPLRRAVVTFSDSDYVYPGR
jgi:hypothetical protein